jgi:hypothetical protein
VSIQGDQVVYDYLSRVGDIAHGKLTPSRRATLVAELRARIESERQQTGAEEPEQVRLLLQRLGEPEAVVAEEVRRSPEHVVRPPERPPAQPLTASPPVDTEPTDKIPVPPPDGTGKDRSGGAAPPWWRAAEEDAAAKPPATQDPPRDRIVVSVSPAGQDEVGPAAGSDQAGSPLTALKNTVARGRRREILAIALLFLGGLIPSLILLVLGYVVALTSKVWAQSDKRFAALAIPLITAITLGVMLWLRVTGRVGGGRPGGDDAGELFTQYVSTLPRVVGLVAAVYLAWRLTRAAKTPTVRGGSARR